MTGEVHASVALVGERGVLIRGASGSGKSSLLLALIATDPARNALVADDRVSLTAASGRIVASVPDAIAGLMEVRGQGIVRRPFVSPVVIDLVVDLVSPGESERMPGAGERRTELAGIFLSQLRLPVDCSDKSARVGVALAEAGH